MPDPVAMSVKAIRDGIADLQQSLPLQAADAADLISAFIEMSDLVKQVSKDNAADLLRTM